MLALALIQTVLVALLGLLVVSLLRSHAAILRRLHDAGFGLDDHDHDLHAARHRDGPGPVPVPLRTRPGVPQPATGGRTMADITGTTVRGSVVSISVSSATPTLLAFLSSGCSTCAGFWQAFASGVDLPGGARLVIVTKGDEAEDPAAVAALAPTGATTVRSSTAWEDFAVPGSPYFVLVASGRVLGEGAALTWTQVHGLLARAVGAGRAGPADPPARGRWQDTDAELRAAGIAPGDPSLYPVADRAGR